MKILLFHPYQYIAPTGRNVADQNVLLPIYRPDGAQYGGLKCFATNISPPMGRNMAD